MIKSILLLLKFGFVGFFNEIRILFKGLSEILISGFDNLNYHIFQPIRLLRSEDVRDFYSYREKKRDLLWVLQLHIRKSNILTILLKEN